MKEQEATVGQEAAGEKPKGRARKGRSKPLIKSSLRLHDRTQFEAIFDYKLELEDPMSFSLLAKQHFTVEVFMFLPQQMGVSSLNYSRSQFYEDLRPLLRLKEPRYSYKDFLGLSKRKVKSPLLVVQSYLRQSNGANKGRVKAEDVIDQVRLFACMYGSYFHKRVQRRSLKIAALLAHHEKPSYEDLSELFAQCQILLVRGHHLLYLWRDLTVEAAAQPSPALKELEYEMRLAGEYGHYRFREGLVTLMAEIGKLVLLVEEGADGEVSEHLHSYRRQLQVWLRYQKLIAHHHGFRWIDASCTLAQQEQFIFRRSQLKKHMWQVLYLETKPRSSLVWRRQVGYMLAASFAAGWAVLANLVMWYKFQIGGPASFGSPESFMGYSGIGIIVAFIAAYVLKDRIKDIGKARFNQGFFGKLPDFSDKVWSRGAGGKMRAIGYVQESVDFVKSRDEVPAKVRQVRESLPTVDLIEREKILYYQKRIVLDRNALKKFDQPMSSVKHIARFGVRRFLTKLDDPLQHYLSVGSDGEVASLLIPKVYHLDLVLRYSYQDGFGKMIQMAVEGHRLVLNKEGLVRIDKSR